jgi:iron-sulfur cluster repair protein YtfE (RIC family)
MNAIDLLKADHETVSKLFEQAEGAQEISEKREIFKAIKAALDVHSYIEETVLYPFFAPKKEFAEMVESALEEHQEMKTVLEELTHTTDDNTFDDKLEELIDGVEHHVKDEEEGLFPKLRKELTASELDEVGARLQDARMAAPGALQAA